MFYVLEGTLTLQLEHESIEARPGTFVCIPPGLAHKFSNPSHQPVRFLNFNTPAGWEDYMRDLGRALADGRAVTSDEIGRIAARYDFHQVT